MVAQAFPMLADDHLQTIVIAKEVGLATIRCQELHMQKFQSRILFFTAGHGLLQLGVSRGHWNQRS